MKIAVAAASFILALSGAASAQNVKEMQLTAASQDCRAGEVAALLDSGVNVNAANSGGYTPLMLAAANGCEAVVRLLLERGADVAIRHTDFGNAAAQAKMNRHSKLVELIEAAGVPARVAAPTVPAQQNAVHGPAPAPAPRADAGVKGWPRLGHYRAGQNVLYSGSGGKTWDRGTIKDIDPQYGYNIVGVTGSSDAFFVVGTAREPFWTGWFVGDWKVSVPVATGAVTDGRYVYRTVSGGMRLPPLRINADGTYSWRVQSGKGETLLQGRWEPNSNGPGVVLKEAERGADWLVYNNSRTGSTLGDTVILSSDCCSHYDGTRL